LFWSAVINGVAAAPIMAAMMVVVSRRKLMGKFAAPLSLQIIGWSATAIMGAAAVAMLVV
jgi:Mn2+/Fe2+ NRAMP family transporter